MWYIRPIAFGKVTILVSLISSQLDRRAVQGRRMRCDGCRFDNERLGRIILTNNKLIQKLGSEHILLVWTSLILIN